MKLNNIPLSEYPRPQLKRDSYLCLNGTWQYAIRKSEEIPSKFDGDILVPFSPETKLSGVNKKVMPDDYLFYKKEFSLKDIELKDKLILNFLAVDQIAEVFINGNYIGKHVGGFLPFSFDITGYLKDKNEIIVRVKDTSDSYFYSTSKQSLNPKGIFYPHQSGIYLPVFLESVSNDYVKNIIVTPDVDNSQIKIKVISDSKKANIILKGNNIEIETNKEVSINIENPRLWSPEDPYLYEFEVKTKNDVVSSYFALRKISLIDVDGIKTIALNNKPYFMKGVLDQGYYKDGLLTPSSYKDYEDDVLLIKSLGFNTSRKHIKIEAPLWYYYCDKHGVIVWQDFVSGSLKYSFFLHQVPLFVPYKISDHKYKVFNRQDAEGRELAKNEFRETIKYLYNVPSICIWTIFNEGWGQFDSNEIYNELKNLDQSRLFDSASGWHDQGGGDFLSKHVYLQKIKNQSKSKLAKRAYIVSECGAYIYDIDQASRNKKNFAYKGVLTKEEFENMYVKLVNNEIIPAYKNGMCAFIYTQLSDVEEEKNGFISYDRKTLKVDLQKIKLANDSIKK